MQSFRNPLRHHNDTLNTSAFPPTPYCGLTLKAFSSLVYHLLIPLALATMSDDDDFMQDSDQEELVLKFLPEDRVLTTLAMISTTRTMMKNRRGEMWILRTNITMRSR